MMPASKKAKLELEDKEYDALIELEHSFRLNEFEWEDQTTFQTPVEQPDEIEIISSTQTPQTILEFINSQLPRSMMLYPKCYYNGNHCAGWIPDVEQVLNVNRYRQVITVERNKPTHHKEQQLLKKGIRCSRIEHCLRCGDGITHSQPMLHCRRCNHFQVIFNNHIYNALWCNSKKMVGLLSDDTSFGSTCSCLAHQGLRLVPRSFIMGIVVGDIILNVL